MYFSDIKSFKFALKPNQYLDNKLSVTYLLLRNCYYVIVNT